MDASATLAKLTGAGITLELADGKIRAKPRDRLTDELRDLIRAHKPALVNALLAEAVTEATKERAAIVEYLGGLPRARAQEVAELAGAFYAHHWSCPTCRAGTQVGSATHNPCPEGARLWDAYNEAAKGEQPC